MPVPWSVWVLCTCLTCLTEAMFVSLKPKELIAACLAWDGVRPTQRDCSVHAAIAAACGWKSLLNWIVFFSGNIYAKEDVGIAF